MSSSVYPTVPGHRLDLSEIGAVMLYRDASGAMLEVPPDGLSLTQSLVNNVLGIPSPGDYIASYVWIIFPRPVNLFSIFINNGKYYYAGYPYGQLFTESDLATSRDSTNGIDGDWSGTGVYVNSGQFGFDPLDPYALVSRRNFLRSSRPSDVFLGDTTDVIDANSRHWSRLNVVPLLGDMFGIRGIRISLDGRQKAQNNTYNYLICSLLLFGEYSQDPGDVLEFLDSSGSVFSQKYLDLGDVKEGSTLSKSFKVKNLSSTLTANSVTASLVVDLDSDPTLTDRYKFDSGGVLTSSISIGSLSPGATSSSFAVKQTTPSGSRWGPSSVTLRATVGSWS